MNCVEQTCRLEIAGATHIGHKRRSNEDRYISSFLDHGAVILAVADGMGGHAGGEIAAQMVIDAIGAFRPKAEDAGRIERALQTAILKANQAILARGVEDAELSSMGSTATVVCIMEGKAFWTHVGDSRFYRLRNEQLTQITTDHTFLLELVEHGEMTAKEAETHPLRNMLDQCVGCEECRPDSGVFLLEPGDRLLLCTDGLFRKSSPERISAILRQNSTPEAISRDLIQSALDSGGVDNVTVVVGVIWPAEV